MSITSCRMTSEECRVGEFGRSVRYGCVAAWAGTAGANPAADAGDDAGRSGRGGRDVAQLRVVDREGDARRGRGPAAAAGGRARRAAGRAARRYSSRPAASGLNAGTQIAT